MTNTSHSNLTGLRLERNKHGRLVLTLADGTHYEAVVPVRAFPLAAPDFGVSLLATDGKEALWIERMADLAPQVRQLIEDGVQYKVPDSSALDKGSRKLLERFL